MFDIIKKLFNRKKNKDKECVASITFELGYNSNINIICSWPDLDKWSTDMIDILASQYGKLLYLIDSGATKREIVEVLSNKDNLKTGSIIDQEFTIKVLENWVFESYADQTHKKPLVLPTNAFKNYK